MSLALSKEKQSMLRLASKRYQFDYQILDDPNGYTTYALPKDTGRDRFYITFASKHLTDTLFWTTLAHEIGHKIDLVDHAGQENERPFDNDGGNLWDDTFNHELCAWFYAKALLVEWRQYDEKAFKKNLLYCLGTYAPRVKPEVDWQHHAFEVIFEQELSTV